MPNDRFYGKESIQARLTIANEAINVLEQLVNFPESELLNNPINIFALKGALIITLQALLDLGLMSIRAVGWPMPSKYKEIADILREKNVLSKEKANALKALAGLRNILVYLYDRVDREVILEAKDKLMVDGISIANDILEGVKDRIDDPKYGVEGFDKIIEFLREKLRGKVKAIFIFGGLTKGYRLKGDIDIAIYLGHRPDPYELGEIVSEITDLPNLCLLYTSPSPRDRG